MQTNNFFQKFFGKKNIHVGRDVALALGIFFLVCILWYGFRCGFEKVCYVRLIEKIVRHEAKVIAPHGAFVVEIANTKSSRELGLSFRKELKEGRGILFIFDTPGQYGFWMKDMLFPLDIIWINKDGFVVEVERDVTPETYPKTFINALPASYILEVNAGEAEKYGVYIGSKVKIER